MKDDLDKIVKECLDDFIKNNTVIVENNWRGYYDYASYQAEDEDELMEYSLIKPKFSGLNVDIYVDDGGAYIRHEHPLWVYFRNGYSKTDNVLPISVENNPKILVNDYKLNISKTDFDSIRYFVQSNINLLFSFADGKISHEVFFRSMKIPSLSLTEGKIMLQEMATIKSKDSGLPVDIWVDEDNLFQGHAPRIKFRASKEQHTTRDFSTMTIGDEPQVLNLPQRTDIDNKSIELVKLFVLYNKDLLLELIQGKIDYHTDFLSQMIKIDSNGKPIRPQNNNLNYESIAKCANGFVMVKSDNGMFNFLNKENALVTPNQWYVSSQPFTQYPSGFYAMVQIDNAWFWLSEDGRLKIMD